VRSVAFSPDGARLASGSVDDTMKVWDARTGQELLSLQGHTVWVTSVAFSPDGARLASGSEDHTVKVWDARTGQELLTLKGPTSEVISVAFSPDGTRLASGSLDQTVKVWDGRLIDRNLSEEELIYRRLVTRPDPAWHAAEGQRFAQAGDWFAAAFHLTQRLRTPPESIGWRRALALCQLAAGQEPAYRQTCAALVKQLDTGLDRDRTGLWLLALSGSGAVTPLPPMIVAVQLKEILRPAVARAVALGPHSIPAAQLLPLAEGLDTVTRALLLHRAGKQDEAVKLLTDQSGPRAQLVRALAERARGRPTEAAHALAQAAAPGAKLPWEGRLELDLLRREAEALLKVPPAQAPGGK
jgi:hypothetical protein